MKIGKQTNVLIYGIVSDEISSKMVFDSNMNNTQRVWLFWDLTRQNLRPITEIQTIITSSTRKLTFKLINNYYGNRQ